MARTGWGRHVKVVDINSFPDDDSYQVGTNEWNASFHKGAGIFGFDAQTVAGHATNVVPNRSVVVLSGSTETGLFGLADSEQYDVIWVFTSGSVVLTNRTTTPNADGQIVGLDTNASTITLSTTIPKIFIRRTVGSVDAWFEYGGGTASNLTLANFDATKIITQTEGIANNDNETTLPTSAAVRDYADTKAPTASPTFTGTMIAATLDISGDVDVDGTLETDALTINGTTLAATINATKIDDLTAGDDNTDIDASSSRHGLFSKLDKVKIDTIETSATADQTGAEIKAAYEAEANAFTDAKNTILSATAGTVSASKAVITDASNNLTGFNNVTIGGNLTVSGTTTTIDTATLVVEDPLIKLAKANTTDSIDIGFYGMHDSGSTAKYTGLFRDQTDSDKWKLFKELQEEPTTTVNTSGTGYAVGTLVANLEGAVTGTDITLSGRLKASKGTDEASASELTLATDGNTFDITGTTTINTISPTGWAAGNVIHLQFDAACQVTHNSGGTNDILLGNQASMTTAAGDVLSLFYNGTDWVEISRSVVSSGGGMHEIQDFDLRTAGQITSYESSRTAGTDGYMFVREIDDENDGLFIKIKKNNTAWTEVQIA